MKTFRSFVAILLVAVFLVGCYTIQYDVGKGAQGSQTLKARQWYILWGLVPLNSPKVTGMIGDAQNYTYRSSMEPVDIVIYCVLGGVTVGSQTITIKK